MTARLADTISGLFLIVLALVAGVAAQRLRPHVETPESIGKIIFIGSLPCRVIGVTKEKEGPMGNSSNLEAWIPSSAAMNRLLGQQYFSSITVRVNFPGGVDSTF